MYRLLIVDDEIWIRKGLRNLIDWQALHVSMVDEAEDADSALEMMNKQAYDIVVTDIRMGVVSGLEMIETARQTSRCPQFIIISGYQSFEYAREAIELDVCAYIVKPIDEQRFVAAVQTAIGKIERSRQTPVETFEEQDMALASPRLIISEVIAYVNQNYAQTISLSAAASYVHLNESYLSKLFLKETGVTFTRYLIKKRIAAAKEMLANPRHKVYEISESIGYRDVKYFVKVFREVQGMTPTEYRESLAHKQA